MQGHNGGGYPGGYPNGGGAPPPMMNGNGHYNGNGPNPMLGYNNNTNGNHHNTNYNGPPVYNGGQQYMHRGFGKHHFHSILLPLYKYHVNVMLLNLVPWGSK